MTPVTAPADTRLSRCTAYLKGEPKALGTVQIMIGTTIFLFGIILTSFALTPGIISGIALWGSLIFISSGALSVAAANHYSSCVVKASLGMNVFSAVAAAFAVILFSVDMALGVMFIPWCRTYNSGRYNSDHYNSDHYYSGHYYSDSYYRCNHTILSMWHGIYGVLVAFSLLEFIISICTSAFACKATCCTETTPMYSQPMYSQQMNSQQMYNPAFYNPQVPLQSSVVTYNNV
ncbi:membrane-spanning 4-domains subfamily A member 4A [Pangasianodon hypophthalmus]|uniref:membrane-spanning 4-domains subfamily A member 4A n=1 Tax=Pangasianodon hypophthalmus TaxID=310915 RepID=UPI000EFDB93F|nr:membrane-spanning 4-domains subfamily A member 4A [Pangasianodon hypophthalmus]